jgi:hypothetical protein
MFESLSFKGSLILSRSSRFDVQMAIKEAGNVSLDFAGETICS